MATSTEVTLIQCTDSKRDTAAKARDLYDESRYFRKMRSWAKARGDPWYILSAKHGLVHPDDRLQPYDERGLSADKSEEIAFQLDFDGVEAVYVCAGRDYLDTLESALEREGIEVVDYFAGMKIGEREQELDRRATMLAHDT